MRSELAATLDAYRSHRDAYGGVGRRDAAERFVNLLPPGARVLDLACGAGHDLAVFAEAGALAVGVDLSAEMLSAAAGRDTGADLVQADFTCLPFADSTFDAVWASAALVHCDTAEARDAVAEIRRVLAPGGAFDLSVKGRHDSDPVSGFVDDIVGRRWFRWWTRDEFVSLCAPLRGATFAVESDPSRSTVWWWRASAGHLG